MRKNSPALAHQAIYIYVFHHISAVSIDGRLCKLAV